ncbi:Beta-crystallin A1 [Caligus rogercresseyi]|uniref:Beta-crystallin A1 n=1 Tax=Caligus rogercresseyi TaxID=217165 RepID=A0A7T8HHC3_CALRO|nr:Beta-crystallin A1 [Caligus rogercresseyi]
MKVTCLILLVLSASALSTKAPQKAVVYDATNLNGNQLNIYGYKEDLSTDGFDNRIWSTRVSGIWLFYENIRFNSETSGLVFFAYGDSFSVNTLEDLNGRVSSVRNSGIGSTYKDISLNIYEKEGFAGEEEYFTNDIPYLRQKNFGESIILTGCLPWTLYSEKYFAGDRICVEPSDVIQCNPGMYPRLNDLPGFHNGVSSARIGCYSTKKLRGNYMQRNSTGLYKPDTKKMLFL